MALVFNPFTGALDFTGGAAATILRGYLAGCGTSNNSGAPNTKIDVAAGMCADSTNAALIRVTAGTIDCGTVGANGLDAGALANSTWYHIFAIMKADTTQALLASTSASAPTLPSGYTYFRRLGSVRTNGSAQILAFTQIEDKFSLAASVTDVSTASMGVATALYGLTVPTGVKVRPIADVGTTAGDLLVFNGDEAGYAPTSGGISGAPGYFAFGSFNQAQRLTDIYTDTSGRIRVYADAITRPLYIYTRGWVDMRGRIA